MLVIKTKAAWQLGLRRRSELLTPNDRIAVLEQKKVMAWLMRKRKELMSEEASANNVDSIQRLSEQINGIYFNIVPIV